MSQANPPLDALQPQAVLIPSETPLTTKKIVIPQHIVFRAFVSETVILNLATGKYYGLNVTGGRMLEVLEAAASVEDAVVALAAEFSVPVDTLRSDLLRLCDDLVRDGLLEIVEG